jgi:hypothetical protein
MRHGVCSRVLVPEGCGGRDCRMDAWVAVRCAPNITHFPRASAISNDHTLRIIVLGPCPHIRGHQIAKNRFRIRGGLQVQVSRLHATAGPPESSPVRSERIHDPIGSVEVLGGIGRSAWVPPAPNRRHARSAGATSAKHDPNPDVARPIDHRSRRH